MTVLLLTLAEHSGRCSLMVSLFDKNVSVVLTKRDQQTGDDGSTEVTGAAKLTAFDTTEQTTAASPPPFHQLLHVVHLHKVDFVFLSVSLPQHNFDQCC